MSQVQFSTTLAGNIPVDVMAGWDYPLKHFFLSVFDLREDAETETLYSTIDDPNPEETLSTKRLRAKLVTLGVTAPPEFWEIVERRERSVQYKFVEGHFVGPELERY